MWPFIRRSVLGLFICIQLTSPSASEQTPTLTQQVHEQLMEAQMLLEKKQHAKAVAFLQNVATRTKLNPYEAAVVQQTLGHAYVALDKLDAAATAFRAGLASQAFSSEEARAVEYNLAQSLIGAERYAEGATVLEAWLAQKQDAKPKPEVSLLLAQVYAQLQRYPEVERYIRQTMTETSEFQTSEFEDWSQLLLVAYVAQNKFRQAIAVLKQLMAQRPDKKTYWLQLSQIYRQTKKERRAAAVLRLAYKMGILEEPEILQLAQYYLYLDLPYTAARILEESLAATTVSQTVSYQDFLITCWLHAKAYPRAIETLDRYLQTASEPRVSILVVRKAEILAQLQRWDEAARALETGLQTRGLKDMGQAYLRLGIAYHQSGKAAASKAAFRKAASYTQVAKQAKQWLRIIANDQNPESSRRQHNH